MGYKEDNWGNQISSLLESVGQSVTVKSQLKVSLFREELIEVRKRSWKGAAVQRGLDPGSRKIATVRNRYLATTSDDIAAWKCLSVIL
jgi:hypothetical protein